MKNRLKLIDVNDRLPSQKNLNKDVLFVFHENTSNIDGRIEGRIGHFSPQDNKWSALDIQAHKEGRIRFEDITEWVNYWAAVPRNSKMFRVASKYLEKAKEKDEVK